MDHREALSTLSGAQRRALTQKSDIKGLSALAVHLGAIGLVSLLIVNQSTYLPLLLVMQGILLVFLFTLLHETIHRTVFETRWLNDLVAHFCGFVLCIQADWFRYFHFAHHRHTQDPENDPELMTEKPKTIGQYVWHVTGLPTWASSVKTLLKHAFVGCDDVFVPPAGRRQVVIEARLVLSAYVLVATASFAAGSLMLVWLWIVPVLLGQPFLRLYLLAEHGRCAFVANMLENSRTTFTNALMRRLAWNMPYHCEHHSYPTVPFHQLPALHAHLKAHLLVTDKGYGRFNRDYVQSLSQPVGKR